MSGVTFKRPNPGKPRQFKFSDHEPVVETINLEDRYRLTGISRQYADVNIKGMLASDHTKELLKCKQMYSYLGHTFYDLGFFSDKAIPVGICESIEYEWPYIQHSERFLITETGKVGESLYDSGTWGYSWAIGGKEGGDYAPTRADFIQGFDLVPIESFISEEKRAAIGEHLKLRDFSDEQIDKIGESLSRYSQETEKPLEEQLFDLRSLANKLQFDNELLQQSLPDPERAIEMLGESFKRTCSFQVPVEIIKMMVNPANVEDADKIAEFFRRSVNVDTSQTPTPVNLATKRLIIQQKDNSVQQPPQSALGLAFEKMPSGLS